MKRALILGVFALVAAVSGQAADADDGKISERWSSLQSDIAECHGVVLDAGTEFVGIVATNHQAVNVVLMKVTKDESGKAKLTPVRPINTIKKSRGTGYLYQIPERGLYVVRVASAQDIQKYAIGTSGTFVGKSFTVKLRK